MEENDNFLDFFREIVVACAQEGNSIERVKDGYVLNLKNLDKNLPDGTYQDGHLIINKNKVYMSKRFIINKFLKAERETFESILNESIQDETRISKIINDLDIFNGIIFEKSDEFEKFLDNCKSKIDNERIEGKSNFRDFLIKLIHNYFNDSSEKEYESSPSKTITNFIEKGILTPEQILDFSNLNKEIPMYKKINIKSIYYSVKNIKELEKFSFARAIGDEAYKENILTSKIRQNYTNDPFLYDLMRDGYGFKILLDIYTNLKDFKDGRITYEDFKKARITPKWIIDNVDVPTFKEFIYCGLGKEFRFDSSKIINLYGSKISGSDLIEIAKKGFVSPEKLVEAGIYKNVQATNPEKAINIQELIDFYTPDRLLEMYENEKISNDFVKKFNRIIKEDNVKFDYAKLIEETKKSVNQNNLQISSDEVLQYYLKKGLIPKEYIKQIYDSKTVISLYQNGKLSTDDLLKIYSSDELKEVITGDKVEELYVENGIISSEDVCKFYNNGTINREELGDLLTNEEILQNVNDGKLKEDTLLIPNKKEQISFLEKAYIDDGTLDEKTLAKLYLNYPHANDSTKGYTPVCYIDAKELRDLTELKEFKNDIKTYIDENYRIENLADLLLARVISISDIKDLEDRGIIKKDDAKTLIEDVIDVEALKSSTVNGVFLVSEQSSSAELKDNRKVSLNTAVRKTNKKCLTDYDTESEAIETLFKVSSKKEDRDIIPLVSKTSDGKNGTLTGYNMYISEPYKIAILDKKEPQNACYVMPTSLAYYFFGRNQDGEEVMKTERNKTNLRNMEGNRFVITLNHSKNFMRNLIKAVGTFNAEAKKDLATDPRCSEYEEFMQKYYEEEKSARTNE